VDNVNHVEMSKLLRSNSLSAVAKPKSTPVPWRRLIVVCLIRVRFAVIPDLLVESLQSFKA
jgi:hypothetical protein